MKIIYAIYLIIYRQCLMPFYILLIFLILGINISEYKRDFQTLYPLFSFHFLLLFLNFKPIFVYLHLE